MNDKSYIIAIDSGTQSVRAIMFDRNGEEVASEQAPHEPYFSLNPGWAEQLPQDYWSKLCHCTRGLMAKIKIDPGKISGIGITSQRATVIPVDKDGNALRPAIIWLDLRTNAALSKLDKTIEFAADLIGGQAEVLRYAHKNSKFMWIRLNEPDVYKKTYKFMHVSGWFVHKLTGEFKDSYAMLAGIYPFDYKALRYFGAPMGFIYDSLGIEKGQCVELYPPDEVLGHITSQASQETGLPEGLPVVVGAGDKQSELLGAGAIDPNIGVISYGTATNMEVITRKFIAARNMDFYTWPAAIPGIWDIEMMIPRGFWMVSWFKQEFGNREMAEAVKRGVAPEVVLDEVIRDIPPGSMGLMLHPYWYPIGNDSTSKGSIIGFGDVHTRAHIYKAIFEGLGYELKRLSKIVEKKTGIPLTEIRVGGGGSKSDMAVQIAADISGLPTYRMATPETCALGAAIDAAVGTGMFDNFEDAVASMTRRGRFFEPKKENVKIYNDLFNEVYMKMCKTIAPLNRKIAKITGYPADE
jgi:sugar (pentulose or hexulose) kinase